WSSSKYPATRASPRTNVATSWPEGRSWDARADWRLRGVISQRDEPGAGGARRGQRLVECGELVRQRAPQIGLTSHERGRHLVRLGVGELDPVQLEVEERRPERHPDQVPAQPGR